jgi:hypothetical protein
LRKDLRLEEMKMNLALVNTDIILLKAKVKESQLERNERKRLEMTCLDLDHIWDSTIGLKDSDIHPNKQ